VVPVTIDLTHYKLIDKLDKWLGHKS